MLLIVALIFRFLKWEEYRESKDYETVLKAVRLREQSRIIDLRPTLMLLSDEDNHRHCS